MINTLGKMLVLMHTVLSLAALTWGVVVIVQGRDFGWAEPAKTPIAFSADGTPTKWVRHASAIDKSRAALEDAAKHRDRLYAAVKPALDDLAEAEPYLADNHLDYLKELNRLAKGKDPLKDPVRRLDGGGLVLEKKNVGKPAFKDGEVEITLADGKVLKIEKTLEAYQEDLKALHTKIEAVQKELAKFNDDTKKFTTELIGTDDDNKQIQPGLYDLIELEYKAQTRYKEELEDIKQPWSTYIEQARQHMFRRTDLEATLQRLKTVMPKVKKKL